MSIKKIKFIGIIITFILCFPLHFLYDIFPNSLFSIFMPVNESIWEHMKLIFTSYLLYGIIDYILLKKHDINNFLLQLFIVPIIGIIMYLIIYIPLYNIFGENMIISIGLLFIIIVIEQILSYYILNMNNIKYQGIIGIIGIIATYVLFGYLTYKPMLNYIFFDSENNKYGINTYIFDK